MYLICVTEMSLFLTTVRDDINAFVPFRHELKNSSRYKSRLAYGAIYEHSIPLSRYCGIGDNARTKLSVA
jgi:hypothetical protein